MQEFIAIFVRDLQTGRVEHCEIFESTGLPVDVVTRRISARTDELNDSFGIERCDVAWEGYSSLQAMHCEHPELGSVETLRSLMHSA